ncbi:MAG: AraC family transcriptional regulator [Verrucomicrobiota bacterium]
MSTNPANFFSLVPEDSPHVVEGDREMMLPGLNLEILAIRKIRLTRWNLKGLHDPYWRLYAPVEGSAVVETGGTETQLTPERIYLIPPRTTINSHNPEPFSKWYVHFVLGRSDLLSVPGVYPIEPDEVVHGHLARLAQRQSDESGPYLWSSVGLVTHALEQLPASAWTDRKLDRRVERVLDFLQSNLSRKINAEDAARAAGVSVRNLNHLFRSQMRMAPMSVLLNFRLDRACHLLRHSDHSIEQIAENCGFPNRYYFSRMLKQHRGISPAAYRKSQLY